MQEVVDGGAVAALILEGGFQVLQGVVKVDL